MLAASPAELATVRTGEALRERVGAWRGKGQRVALVPTMGALHEGHRSLVRLARRSADRVVASLFVNPAQFGQGEDFGAYPRDEAADAAALAECGCDLLFAPSAEAIYPIGFATTVSVAGPAAELEGAVRPGHFAGVATVVAKLLLLAGPDTAVFGEKDYQQLVVVRRLVADLAIPTEILAAPTMREPDGLALSSRNVYLSAGERRVAPALHRALARAADRLREGGGIAAAEEEGREAVLAAGFDSVDYFAARDAETLAASNTGPRRLLAAARLGRTRLIDNVAV